MRKECSQLVKCCLGQGSGSSVLSQRLKALCLSNRRTGVHSGTVLTCSQQQSRAPGNYMKLKETEGKKEREKEKEKLTNHCGESKLYKWMKVRS